MTAFTSLDEIRLSHLACVSWSNSDCWVRYFTYVQDALQEDITHLDKNDPVRRRVPASKLSEVADYITAFDAREDSRWVFGKIATIGVEFTVRTFRQVKAWPNSIDWYFPANWFDDPARSKTFPKLFDCGNATLSPFYGYADTTGMIARKKKESGAVNIQAELIGVF